MNPYEEYTERQWFIRDRRDALHRCDDERDAFETLADYAREHGEGAVVFYRDVTTGALTKAEA